MAQRFYELGGGDFDLIVRALRGHRIIARGYVLNPDTPGKRERCEFHERNFKFWSAELERVENLLDKLGES